MSTVVGDIAISIGADIAPLVTNLGKAKGQISSFGRSAETTASGGMSRFTAGAALMGSAVAAAGLGLITLTKRVVETGGALHDASLKTGVHVAALQAMSQVANEASVSTDALYGSISKMQNAIAGLSQGTQTQVDAFGRLGLSIRDMQGKSPDEQFTAIAAAIDGLGDPAAKTAAAMDIFGKSGADLIPMMQDYARTISDVAQKQRDMGIALSDDQAAQLDDIGDSMARLSMASEGLGNQLILTFGPALQNWLIGTTAMLKDVADAVNTTGAEQRLIDISDASEIAAGKAESLALSFQGLADGKISDGFRKQAESIRMATESFKAGVLPADKYKQVINDAFLKLVDLTNQVHALNGGDISGIISQFNTLGGSILKALGFASQLAAATPGAAVVPSTGFGGRPEGLAGLTANRQAVIVAQQNIAGNVSSGGGGGGGGGGNNLDAELQQMRDQYAAKADLMDQQYTDDLTKLKEFRDAKLLTEQEYNDLEAEITQTHEDKLREIHDRAQAVKLQAISGAFGDLSSLMQTHNKTLFEIGKKASLAAAVVDGYTAATAAWKSGMAVGGPVVAAAFTAASLAKTGAMIAGIQSTTMGGGSGGSASAGGSGVPSIAAPAQANITFIGQSATVDSLQSLVAKLNDAYAQGYRLNILQGAA